VIVIALRELGDLGLALMAGKDPELRQRLQELRNLYFFDNSYPSPEGRLHDFSTLSGCSHQSDCLNLYICPFG
jgi:hypothetical protein